jgi:hypothetical protein
MTGAVDVGFVAHAPRTKSAVTAADAVWMTERIDSC